MNNKNYSVEDFLKDEHFVEWVKYPTQKSNTYWENWLVNHPGHKKVIMQAKETILSVNYKNRYELSEESLNDLFEQVNERYANKETPSKTPAKKFKGLHMVFVAAALSIVVLLAGVYLMEKPEATPSEQSIVKQALPGSKLSFELNDGTKVKLNGDSRLYIAPGYGTTHREVVLQGEGFFDIVPNNSLPFEVHFDSVVAKAVGTTFNIKAYQDDPRKTISLTTGKVLVTNRLNREKKALVLLPGEQAITSNANEFIKNSFNTEAVLAWKTGTLLFDNTSFKEVLKLLARWYGVSFSVRPKLMDENRAYNGSFTKKSLEEVLHVLGVAGQFDFEIKENQVKITFNNQ